MRLRTKFSVFSTLLVALVGIGITGVLYWNEKERLHQDFQNERFLLVRSLVRVSHDAIVANDDIFLARYLKELKATVPEIVWAGVHHAGEVVAHTESKWIGKTPTDSETLQAISSNELVELSYLQGSVPILEVCSPIKAGELRIGTARVAFSQKAIQERFNSSFRKHTRRIFQIALIAIILGVAASVLLAQTMTARLGKLVSGARTIATGKFNEQIFVKGSDEIKELATEFNLMANRLDKLYSQVREQTEMLSRANLELIKLDSIKKNFFSLVSHELRGPLTTIKGYLTMLLDSAGMEGWKKQERQIQIVSEETNRMIKMVNDFLDLARIETGMLKIEKKEMHPKMLTEYVVERMEPEAQACGVKLTCQIEENLPTFLGDSDRLAQVLINLLTNALKFTPAGGTILLTAKKIERGRRAEDVEQIRFTVEDTGKGIAKEYLERIFERYAQIEGKESRKGLGLGLAFCREVVHLHGGKIWAESDGLGKGATFIILLPTEIT